MRQSGAVVTSEVVQRALEALQEAGCVKAASELTEEGVRREGYKLHFETRRSDTYWRAMTAAWRRIAENPYLPGMMRWLQKAKPRLHCEILQDIPERIDLLWDAGAPLAEFQELIDRWVHD